MGRMLNCNLFENFNLSWNLFCCRQDVEELKKKKEELRKEVAKKFDEALPYFEKVDQILGGQGKLKMEDKQSLKDAYDLLIMIYENKDNKEKAAEYTEKFNTVDKKHS